VKARQCQVYSFGADGKFACLGSLPPTVYKVEQGFQPVVRLFLGGATTQLVARDNHFLIFKKFLATEIQIFNVEGPIRRLAVFTSHFMLPPGAVPAAVGMCLISCSKMVLLEKSG